MFTAENRAIKRQLHVSTRGHQL